MKNIPSEVLKSAKDEACNSVEFCGTYQGEEVYSIGSVDSEGLPIPTGLPVFILYKDGNIRMVRGMKALDLLIELKD